MTKKKISIREEAQNYLDGDLVASMIMDFQHEMRDVYEPDVMNSSLCAVGPLQTMIGLAIKNGHLPELDAYDKGYDDGYDHGRWTD